MDHSVLFFVKRYVEAGMRAEGITRGKFKVVGNHFPDHFFKGRPGSPAEFGMGLRGIAEQGFHFGRTIVTRISTHNDLSRLEHIGKITLFRQERSETVDIHGFDYRMLVGPLAHELQRQSAARTKSRTVYWRPLAMT